MAEPIRKPKVVRFTQMVQDTIVKGLLRVFTDEFREKQLQGLHIVTEYPLKRQEYPSIIVDFEDDENRAAGVGHQEVFYDPNGILRVWDHRRFKGRINFRVYALSPIDRDIIYDALVETLSFGHLPTYSLQANLFSELYGDPDDPFDRFRALNQLNLNTDILRSGGKSASPAPWESEDDLVYTKTLTIEVNGGFYNQVPGKTLPQTATITAVHVYPHMNELMSLPLYQEDDPFWDRPGDVYDEHDVLGVATVTGEDDKGHVQINSAALDGDGFITINGVGFDITEEFLPVVVRYHSGGLIGIVSDVWLNWLATTYTDTQIVLDYSGVPGLASLGERLVSVSLGLPAVSPAIKHFLNDRDIVVGHAFPSGIDQLT